MEDPDSEAIEQSFRQFHAWFQPAFGRKQHQERSRDYLRGLLVQAAERGNAENLAEVVESSARVLQRFLTEARWSDHTVIERLQALAVLLLLLVETVRRAEVGETTESGGTTETLPDPNRVWAVDESGFPKQGKKSAGVAPQYCGALGKVANCQIGVFLCFVGPGGRLLVDKRLYLPKVWTNDPARCEEAGIPKEAQEYQSKTELALEMLRQARQWGYLQAGWVTGDDA